MKVGARYYDPKIGRWIQKAPILSGFNWWVYCENDPVNYADPKGYSILLPSPGDLLTAIGIGLLRYPHPLAKGIGAAIAIAGCIWSIYDYYHTGRGIIGAFVWLVFVKPWREAYELIFEEERKPMGPLWKLGPIPPPYPIPPY